LIGKADQPARLPPCIDVHAISATAARKGEAAFSAGVALLDPGPGRLDRLAGCQQLKRGLDSAAQDFVPPAERVGFPLAVSEPPRPHSQPAG